MNREMTYKPIFTVWDNLDESKPALDMACEMIRKEDVHLNILCLGIDRIQTGFYYSGQRYPFLVKVLNWLEGGLKIRRQR